MRGAVGEIVRWWNSHGGRDLPWRSSPSPWGVLIAEFLLIQTDAAKVSKIYQRFLKRFPTPEALNSASESEVAEMLKPLGLYRQRAKRLKGLAAALCAEHRGKVPESLEDLKALPGVGDYIAGAVSLFAFGKATPLVDVNTSRVLLRILHGVDPPKRYVHDGGVREAAASIFWSREVAYALIDFAFAICRPKRPACSSCPASKYCAYAGRKQ